MSKVQRRDSDFSSELGKASLKNRCEACKDISTCKVCGSSISGFDHVGVRAAAGHESGIWHYASPCRHRNQLRMASVNVKYNGGPFSGRTATLGRVFTGGRTSQVHPLPPGWPA